MRKPEQVEQLYLDFDGFFASIEQQARPGLRGRPVGVVPFDGTSHTCVIACSKEAKARGVKNIMNVEDARAICPEIVLVPQSPDLYRRAHNALLSEIAAVIPIEAVKSIDELTCRLSARDRAAPHDLSRRIKQRLARHVGPHITCSIGMAANRQLAKIAGKMDKPDGTTIWHPQDMPGPLLPLSFEDIPGIGKRMRRRLCLAGIGDMTSLLATEPKQLRAIWGNVTGERLWYALHGYDVRAGGSSRGMYGHGRVLPPDFRTLKDAHGCSRLLLVKAARRMRRGGFYAARLALWLSFRIGPVGREQGWGGSLTMPIVHDDQACLAALQRLWERAWTELPRGVGIVRLGVTLMELSPAGERQLDMLLDDDRLRLKWERVTAAADRLNMKYGRTVVSLGPWTPPPGGYAGGKISYTRIPHAEDFW
ncbi:MAG: type VI secretion protein ImpB [Hyphomicrobiales bacterium]|nr:MAG: type VI secretion protein ImpB [Hyphomicrobiales bacterium]